MLTFNEGSILASSISGTISGRYLTEGRDGQHRRSGSCPASSLCEGLSSVGLAAPMAVRLPDLGPVKPSFTVGPVRSHSPVFTRCLRMIWERDVSQSHPRAEWFRARYAVKALLFVTASCGGIFDRVARMERM